MPLPQWTCHAARHESRKSPEKSPSRLADVCPDLVGVVFALLRDSHPGDPCGLDLEPCPFIGSAGTYLALSGVALTATEALSWGLVDEVWIPAAAATR
ncbi:hypothetical protein [Streptomyces sp. PSKA30]|uniref:hypothetical protein n=1 Tax=Streptomyces sp. PSKA30 TaxID=2874597 RepID=UPI001CD0A179|nr:hypothetical protein [Streptomyces sp. PSKA30]MBZ9643947.1 hypothetical protein [Streptomyces sp. PSKA30]